MHDLDASTSVEETEWFSAGAAWVSMNKHCCIWAGQRQYHCLDVFSHSQKFARKFAHHGFKSIAFDIKTHPSNDITTRSGFTKLLDLGLGRPD